MTRAPFFYFLSSNGDGSGGDEATNDFTPSATNQAQVLYLQPPQNVNYDVARLIVHIADAGGFNADNYGGLSGPLVNGLIVRKRDQSNNITDYTRDAILNSADWGKYAYDVNYLSFGAGDNFLQINWLFDDSGMPVPLDGAKGERLEVVIQDDFSGLDEHTFLVHGVASYDYDRAKSLVVTNIYIGNLSNLAGTNAATTNRIIPTPPPPLPPGG